MSQSQFGDALKDSVRNAAKERLREMVESIVCPVHGQHAQVNSIEESSTGWNYSIHGCCDAVKQEVEKILSQK